MTYSGIDIPAYLDFAEIAQVIELARAEADRMGFDPDAAAREAVREHDRERQRYRFRERPATDAFPGHDRHGGDKGRLGWLDAAARVRFLSPPRTQTAGQKSRFERDQMIFALAIGGFSRRRIARQFGLPHSRVTAIVGKMGWLTRIA